MSSDVREQQGMLSPDGQWVWDGSEWTPAAASVPTPPQEKPRRALKIGGIVVGGFTALLIAGAAMGGGTTSSESNASESSAPVAEEAEQGVAEPEAAPVETPQPQEGADEHDSLETRGNVEQARGDLVDLNEDISDMQRDLARASSNWAMSNAAGITFNMAQLQAFEAPASIADAWNGGMVELTAAHEALLSGIENDSISQMTAALSGMEQAAKSLQGVIESW